MKVCFTYPNDRKKLPFLQMFFLQIFMLEKLLNPFAVKKKWRCNYSMRNKITNEQFDSYKFDIDNSYCDANDVNISFNIDKDGDR